MTRKYVAGNWKMNLDRTGASILLSEITGMLESEEMRQVNVLLFPPFVHIRLAIQMTMGDPRIKIGAQNCSSYSSGAYTGEISAAMLKSCGCTHVLVGHSERRTLFGETDKILADKINRILEQDMTPVFCIGEQLSDREHGKHYDVIKKQLEGGVFHLDEDDFVKCILAYEPVWAIGTGVNATPAQAQEMHAAIRNMIAKKYGALHAATMSIIYGGSCNDQNASDLFSLLDVDGGLIGGASLSSRSFVNIVKSLP